MAGGKRKIKYFLKNIFFPRNLTCSACGRESFTGGILCEKCLSDREENNECICEHCGVKTPVPVAYCDRCRNRLTSFDTARSAFVYDGVVALLLQKLKYGGEKYLAEEFAKDLYKLFATSVTHADGIVCVPMSRKRERERGYNQSELLARNLSALSGVPFLDVTVKRKETESQVGKNYKERRKNLDGSFGISDKKAVRDKRIVIADDVSTTGTTSDILAAALKAAGAAEVFVLTVASVVKRKPGFANEGENETPDSADVEPENSKMVG